MSIELMALAYRARTGNPSAKAVLVALADHANSSGICWPSFTRIAFVTELSPKSVERWIPELVRMGHITILEKRFGSHSKYRVHPVLPTDPDDTRTTDTESVVGAKASQEAAGAANAGAGRASARTASSSSPSGRVLEAQTPKGANAGSERDQTTDTLSVVEQGITSGQLCGLADTPPTLCLATTDSVGVEPPTLCPKPPSLCRSEPLNRKGTVIRTSDPDDKNIEGEENKNSEGSGPDVIERNRATQLEQIRARGIAV